MNLKIQSPRVCEGVSQLFGGEVIYVLKRVTIGPDEVCSFVIGDACGDVYNPYHEWEVEFPPVPKPDVVDIPLPKEGVPTFKVLHLCKYFTFNCLEKKINNKIRFSFGNTKFLFLF